MDITTYFESEDFLNIIAPLGKYCDKVNDAVDNMNFLISAGIDYWRIFNDRDISMDKFNKFMSGAVSTYEDVLKENGSALGYYNELRDGVYDLYIDDLLDRFNLNREDLANPVVNRGLREFVAKKILSIQYKFHAFNGSFLESIAKYGLDSNHKFEVQEELDMINDIFERHGESLILGWQKLNCDGKVSYADSANNSYYYAVNSPEWFAQFTGQGFSFNPKEKYYKSAFITRNYAAASNNLMTLMKEKNFASDEIEVVNGFFNKYWDMYANEKSGPMLCVIPNKNNDFDSLYDWAMNNNYCKESLSDLISLCFYEGENDGRTSSVISTENALFVRLPEVSRVLEKMNVDNKGNNIKK